MIKFIWEYENELGKGDKVEITLGEDSLLPDVLQTFERFLGAAGYVFDGHLELVEEEEPDGNH